MDVKRRKQRRRRASDANQNDEQCSDGSGDLISALPTSMADLAVARSLSRGARAGRR